MAGRGNPRILEIQKLTRGPSTDLGKLVVSAIRYNGKALQKKFEKAGLSLDAFKAFQFFIRTQQTKGLNEITRMEDLINLLESDLAMRAMLKIEKGVALDQEDIKQIRVLKEAIVDLHKMKYGEKTLNVTASYRDIQDMMFGNPKAKLHEEQGRINNAKIYADEAKEYKERVRLNESIRQDTDIS